MNPTPLYTVKKHRMSPESAAQIAHRITQKWPTPELTEGGLALLILEILDTGLDENEASEAVRTCQQNLTWRPAAPDLRNAHNATRDRTKANHLPDYFKPFTPEIAAPADPAIATQNLTEMRRALTQKETTQ